MKKENRINKLSFVDKIFGSGLFFLESKENTGVVVRNLNIVAFIISFVNATYLLFTGNMTMDFLGITTCYLPSILCIATEFFFRCGELYGGMVFSNTMVPLSLVLKGVYEPIPGIMLYPLAFGIVSFFILPTIRLVYYIYSLSVVCFIVIDVAYHYKYNPLFNENVSLIIFNDLLFGLVVFTVLGYLRNLLANLRRQRKIKEKEIISQNQELQAHQEEIANQNLLLQQRNQLLIESWHFQQKITSVLSHDTRTSLIFLKHIVTSSRRMTEKNAETEELLSELDREISNMTGTFDNVLLWLKQPSTISNINKEELLLHDIVEEIIFTYKGQAKTKEILIVNDVPPLFKLYISREYLRTILRNLIGNAIKFSKKNGVVRIASEENSQYSYLYVIDNGMGITEANLLKINEGAGFSTIGTMQEEGTGMGLIFCRNFIKKSEGEMKIVSDTQNGTTVIVSLPLKVNKSAIILAE